MSRRLIRTALATVILAAGFVLVPVPRLVWATEMTTDSTNPAPRPVGEAFVDPTTVPEAGGGHDDDSGHDQGRPAGATRAEDRSLVADHDAGAFTTIGVGWAAEVDPSAVIVRTRTDGVWGPWFHLAFSQDHRPDDERAAAAVSEPSWVGTSDGYEIHYPAALGDPTVHLVREVPTEVAVALDEPTSGADPLIRPRSAWNARSPKVTPSTSATLEAAIVHHSVTSNSYSSTQVPGILRSIQAFHMDVRGWDDIAYNFAVDRFGQVWEARAGGIDRTVIGGHAYGFNVGTTGVLVLGTHDGTAPTFASLEAASDLIAWKFALHHVPNFGSVTLFPGVDTHHGPSGTPVVLDRISGHRNTGQTSCPGNRLHGQLDVIRYLVGARVEDHRLSAPPLLIGGDRTGDGRADALVYHPGRRGEIDLAGRGGPGLERRNAKVDGLYEPLSGDFDGNGVDDVFWYRPGPQPDYVWYGRVGGGHRVATTNIDGDYRAMVGDFDGDRRDDIVLYGDYGTSDHVFWGGTTGFIRAAITVDDHVTPVVGDFDGDGRDDIVWYGWGGRPDHLSWGRADRAVVLDAITVPGRFEPFVGDFDADGSDDVFWYAPGPDSDEIWSGGASREFETVAVNVGGVYDPLVGDFDGDGSDDILWYAAGPALDYEWLNAPSGRVSISRPVHGTYEALVLDADGDDRDEILWVADTDVSYLWSRTGTGTRSTRVV